MTVKGLEMPAYDPRGMQGQGLSLATSNRGACHTRGNMLGPEVTGLPKLVPRLQVQGKGGIVTLHQNAAAAIDSLVVCKFVNMAVAEEYLARALSATTGIAYSTADLLRAGERIWNLERLYNLREGFTRADDTLPRRLLEEPVAEGPNKGWVSHLPEMLDEYYSWRGWDSDGVPSAGKLAELGLQRLDGAGESKAMIDEQIQRQFQEIGRDLYVADLVSSHGGNLSVRLGDRVIIKRRGAMLGRLKEGDLIETRLEKPDSGVVLASTELVVHRAIYLATPGAGGRPRSPAHGDSA